jgi:hypothetical protein
VLYLVIVADAPHGWAFGLSLVWFWFDDHGSPSLWPIKAIKIRFQVQAAQL